MKHLQANRHSFPHHPLISFGWQMMALSTEPINVMTLRHTEDPMLWLTAIFIIDNCPSLYLYTHQCNCKLKMNHLSKLENCYPLRYHLKLKEEIS